MTQGSCVDPKGWNTASSEKSSWYVLGVRVEPRGSKKYWAVLPLGTRNVRWR